MDLHHLSVGFEPPPKLLVRHLRTQVSNKEVFHDVSPTGNFLIVGSCRAIRQEDEVERAAPLLLFFCAPIAPVPCLCLLDGTRARHPLPSRPTHPLSLPSPPFNP